MKQKKTSFGKVLIFLSFFVIIIGAIVSIGETTGYVDGSHNIVVPHSDDKITIVTKDDSKDLVVNDNGMIVKQDENNASGNNSNSGNTNSGNSGNTNNGGNNNSSTPSNPTPSTPVQPVQPSVVNTIDVENNSIRSAIQNQYGIKILYGSETSGYSVGGLSTSIIEDPYVINNELVSLRNNLSLYPSGFFKELNGSIPLTIYLLNSYSNTGVCGVTDSNYSRAIMSLASGTEFVETFHHENYHYMERYMFKSGASFADWVKYNPVGFRYGNDTSYPVYNLTFSPDVYFVNTYARDYDEFEDRASTFEYMMAANKASCLNYDMPIYKKAVFMSNMIDQTFRTCSSGNTEYWERFIK